MWTFADSTVSRVASILLGLFIITFTLLFDESWSMYCCVWIGCLLLKKSVLMHYEPLNPTITSRKSSRRYSACPKSFTPAAPISVVTVRPSKKRASRIPTSSLLISEETPKNISSYNDESFMTGTTECTPVSEPQSLHIPDSIAAIWEPTIEPTSSKVW